MLGPLRSAFTGLMGVNDNYNVSAPTVDTKAGTAAIQGQAAQQTERARAQGYSLAVSARGSSSPLALREAQRRAGMAQTQIANDAMIQQRALEQAAAVENARNRMRAAELNAASQAKSDAAWMGMVGTIGGGVIGGMAGGPAGAYIGSQAGGQLASDVSAKTDIVPADSGPMRPNPYVGSFAGVQPSVPRYEPTYAQSAAQPQDSFLGAKYGSQLAGHDDGRRVTWAGAPPQTGAQPTTTPQLAAESARVAAHARSAGVDLGPADWSAMGYQPPGTAIQQPAIRTTGGMRSHGVYRHEAELAAAPQLPPLQAGQTSVARFPDVGQPSALPPVGSPLQGGTYLGDIDGLAQAQPAAGFNWGMPISDRRAKTAEAEVSALRSVVDRLTGGARAAGSVVAPGMVRAVAPAPQTMQTGAIQRPPDALDRQKAAVGGEAAAAAYGEQWVRANARAAQLEQIRQQDEADRIAAAQAGLARAQNQAGFIDATQASRQAEQEVSDERAKDVLAALRQRAQEGEPGPETASFLQRARERMNEDQEKKLDHALLSAGLDRIAREATVDGGPPLQAGRTNVARFDDVPAADMRQRHPLVAAATTTPISTWRYKPGFATETNIKNGLPPDAPQGFARRTGPMAQDLEQNPLYAPAVATGPDGMKRVDAGTTTMANTAVIADMARFAAEQEERIKRLEAGRSRVAYPKPKAAGL